MLKKYKSRVVAYGAGILFFTAIYVMNSNIVVGAATFLNPDTSTWFAWSQPDEVIAKGTALDVSYLLDAPAGKHGYIRATGENLAFDDSTPVRFWGANISGSPNFLSHTDTDNLVARMARSGLNIARLISMDGDFAQPNIFGNSTTSTRVLNADSMDKFSYLWAKLKEKGIYLFVELKVNRQIKSGDGATYSYMGANVTYTGGMDLVGQFDPYLIELQKEYAKQLLTYVNPYTGTTLANDPAVVMVAMDNENSLTEYGTETFSSDISFAYYKDLLKDKFNQWLRAKYGTRDALVSAWASAGYTGLESQESQFELDGVGEAGTVEIPIDYLSTTKNYSAKRKEDTLHFLSDTERDFRNNIYANLRSPEVGVRALITGGGFGTWRDVAQLRVAAETTDFISKHGYWGHPLSAPFTYTTGTTPRQSGSQLSDSSIGGRLADFAKRRVYGKPFVIGEYQIPESNQYLSEASLLMAAYANLQNWHPIMYNFHDGTNSIGNKLVSVFTINNHPIRLNMLPASALIFHRKDVNEASNVYFSQISTADMYNPSKQNILPSGWTPGVGLIGKTGVSFQDLNFGSYTNDPSIPTKAASNPRISDNNDLTWNQATGVFTLNTNKSQAVSGKINGSTVDLSDMNCTISNEVASVVLNSLTDQPISTSTRMLLTTASRARNTNTTLSETDSSITNGGTSPIIVEPILGNVVIKSTTNYIVYKLTSSGLRNGIVSSTKTPEGYTNIPLTAANKTLNYEIVPVKYEGENLTIAGSSGETIINTDDPASSNGKVSVIYANAVNDYVKYAVPSVVVPNPGQPYRVYVGTKKGYMRGKFRLYASQAGSDTGSYVGDEQDLYSATSSYPIDYPELDLGTWTPTVSGDQWFKFMVTGKNADSSSYSLAIDYIRLELQ